MEFRDFVEKTRKTFFPHLSNAVSTSCTASSFVKRLESTFKPPSTLMNFRKEEAQVWLLLQVQYVLWSISDESQSSAAASAQNHEAFQMLSLIPPLFSLSDCCPFIERGCVFKTIMPRNETVAYSALKNKLRAGKNSLFADKNEEGNIAIFIERFARVVFIPRNRIPQLRKAHEEAVCPPLVLKPLNSDKNFCENLTQICVSFFFCKKCCSAGLFLLGKPKSMRNDHREAKFLSRMVDSFKYIYKTTSSEDESNDVSLTLYDQLPYALRTPAEVSEADTLVRRLLQLDAGLFPINKYVKLAVLGNEADNVTAAAIDSEPPAKRSCPDPRPSSVLPLFSPDGKLPRRYSIKSMESPSTLSQSAMSSSAASSRETSEEASELTSEMSSSKDAELVSVDMPTPGRVNVTNTDNTICEYDMVTVLPNPPCKINSYARIIDGPLKSWFLNSCRVKGFNPDGTACFVTVGKASQLFLVEVPHLHFGKTPPSLLKALKAEFNIKTNSSEK